MRKLTRAAQCRRSAAASRQRAYRARQKINRRPTTEDIAIVYLHFVVTEGTSDEAKRNFEILSERILKKLVALGFNPVASRMAFDDLVERYENGEALTRGPNNLSGGVDISSYLPNLSMSPHYSISRRDVQKHGFDVQALVVEETQRSDNRRQLNLSTAHVAPMDLELLLEEAVFGKAFHVSAKETAFVIPTNAQELFSEEQIRQRLDEGYSEAFCEVLLFAGDMGVEAVALAADGGICPDLSCYAGTEVSVSKPFDRLRRLVG
ncbi:hypothetical protein J0X15_01635 [Roseibium sp. CAU 1637]|uniref:DUF5983 domain-containing protein n=1 Tax=Roseibium limicola TaxID=2816037 RepID=A0A939EM95_9HYPH|nr:hypothetical protein [Roseibium limicola]MBO0343908.1 hypothetical protein [Roseibium limicola]